MTELDRALVRRKLAGMADNLDRLRSMRDLSLEEYRSDWLRRKAIERLLQETIEAAVDVNQHVLSARGERGPFDYYQSFIAMGRSGALPGTLAEALAPAAGLRNRLVHEYDPIDDEIVLQSLHSALTLFADYAGRVERLLADE